MKENSISYYFEKYSSDKHENGYSEIYDEIFSLKKYDDINLLEIGIGTLNYSNSNMIFWKNKHENYFPGASLRAFRDYFPNGKIFGADRQPDCMIFFEERIHTFLFDSTIKNDCDKFLFNLMFDFIVDDGDHYFKSQTQTFENLYPKLKPGGIYVIEDLAFPQEIKNYFENTEYNYNFRNPPYGLVFIKKKHETENESNELVY
jgi:hypothetical protein